jgi:hypothetical protein
MYQPRDNVAFRFIRLRPSALHGGRLRFPCRSGLEKRHQVTCLVVLLLFIFVNNSLLAQEKSPEPLQRSNADLAALVQSQPQAPATPAKRPITITDAVSIFLERNFQLVEARYEIDTAEG